MLIKNIFYKKCILLQYKHPGYNVYFLQKRSFRSWSP
jgi:hypothetical protein